MATRDGIALALRAVAGSYPDVFRITAEVGTEWWVALSGYEDAEIVGAVREWARVNEKCPRISNIRGEIDAARTKAQREAQGEPTENAADLARDVLEYGRKQGHYDGVIAQCVADVVGRNVWYGITRKNIDEIKRVLTKKSNAVGGF